MTGSTERAVLAGDRDTGVFQPLAPAVHAIHRRLKNVFDPAGVFNRGRMYKEF